MRKKSTISIKRRTSLSSGYTGGNLIKKKAVEEKTDAKSPQDLTDGSKTLVAAGESSTSKREL